MSTVKLLHKISSNNWNFTQFRFLSQNHYEILKLQRNCSNNDIRKAFVKLSKEYHPDKQKEKDTHDQYVRIIEAYKVLKNPNSRANYDFDLETINVPQYRPGHPHSYSHRTYYHYDDPVRRAWSDPSFYANRNDTRYAPRNEGKTEFFIALFAIMGGVFIIYSFTMWKFFHNRKVRIDKETARNYALLYEINAEAERNGNDKQIEKILKEMTSSD